METFFFIILLLSITLGIIFTAILLIFKAPFTKKALIITGIAFVVSFIGFAGAIKDTSDAEEALADEENNENENGNNEEDTTEDNAEEEDDSNNDDGENEEDEDEPVMDLTVDEFRDNFDSVAGEFGLSFRSNKETEITDGEVYDTQQLITASDHVSAFATLTKDGDIVSLNLVGSGDGTQESGFEILASIGATMAAVEPELTPEQRGDLLGELGILGDDGITEDFTQVENDGILYSFNMSEATGVMFFVEPAE